ncbi:FecR domain-containing protein, partial [Gammaproteobacteria bacterium]|nr:FecR domain-containing protein [Gammaproteobacteria bacterium]
MKKLLNINIFMLALLVGLPAVSKEEIGVASAVNKNTSDLTLEEERKLVQAGYKIIQNHTLETDAIGRAALLLIDGTSLSIGPDSSVTLDKFIYNPETAEGSLEVSSRGLLRLVGGKVTKKRPALIRTNSATVGIRGGITIVQTQGLSTSAAFVYGDELTMTPNQNSSAITSLTKNGFVVTVEDPTAEVGEPQQLSETFLDELQNGLEAREDDEGADAETSEEESNEESTQEESSEETTTEESASEDQGQDSETQQESNSATETETGSDNSTPQEDSASDSNVVTQTSDQADTSAGVDNDPQPDVDESALDSSGVSDISSNTEPSNLSTSGTDEANVDLSPSMLIEESEEEREETEVSSAVAIVASDGQVVETVEGSGSAVATISEEGVIVAIASSSSETITDGDGEASASSSATAESSGGGEASASSSATAESSGGGEASASSS